MTNHLLAMAHLAEKEALRLGAEGVRVGVSRTQFTSIEHRDGKLDRMQDAITVQLGVALFIHHRFSLSNTSDLRPEALRTFIGESVELAKRLAEDPHRHLPDPSRYTAFPAVDLEQTDPSFGAITALDLRKTAADLETASRDAGPNERILSVTTGCDRSQSELALVCSNGFEGSNETTDLWHWASVTLQDQNDRRPEGSYEAGGRRKTSLLPIGTIGAEALRRARIQLGARPIDTGVYTAIVENQAAGRLSAMLKDPIQGSMVQQRRSYLEGKLGQKIASDILTITDDPFVPQGLRSCFFDGEGMTNQRRPVIESGVLKNYYLDTYYASKLGMEPTTGSITNWTWSLGPKSLDQLVAETDRGILVMDFLGGNSNPTTGDFSLGIQGLLIEKGRTTQPVSGMNIAGSQADLWNKLAALGNDPWTYASDRRPSLRFDGIQFSGV